MTDMYAAVIKLIDDANALDPNLEQDENGQAVAKELLYSQRMSVCLADFMPQASTHLKIAARGQHIERWKSPRADYPEGRAGYLKWRRELGVFHAARVAELMSEVGFPDSDIDRTKFLVQKRAIKQDAESQCLEDVICLVFLKYYLVDFASKHDEQKLISIIQKTWKKMSDDGHRAALELPFDEAMSQLITKALS